VIIGVPANNFGNQEPGSNKSIQEFCSLTYGVSFPMSEKVSVKGPDIHPLYRYLTSETANTKARGSISWNFNKFLIDQTGHVVKRYGPTTNPMSDTVLSDIDALIKH
jgi:glutathione peroxidase